MTRIKARIYSKIREKQGVALMSVLLFFLVMVTLIGGLTILTHGNLKVSTIPEYNTATYYAAEAGVNTFISELQDALKDDNLDLFDAQVQPSLVTLSNNASDSSNASVTFQKNVDAVTGLVSYKVLSTGNVGGYSRTIETVVGLDYLITQGFPSKYAILTKGKIEIGKGTYHATGDEILGIASTTTDESMIKIDKIQGNTTLNIDALIDETVNIVEFDKKDGGNVNINQLNEIPQFPDIDKGFETIRVEAAAIKQDGVSQLLSSHNLYNYWLAGNKTGLVIKTLTNSNLTVTLPMGTKSYYFKSLVFGPNNKDTNIITIHSDEDVLIVTDSLVINSQVEFTGTGKVRFYVTSKVDINNAGEVIATPKGTQFKMAANLATFKRKDITTASKLTLYVDKIKEIDNGVVMDLNVLELNSKAFVGSYMFNNANISWDSNANSVTVIGNLVTGGDIIFKNSGIVTGTLVSGGNIVFMNGANIIGAMISNTFESKNVTEIQHTTPTNEDFPFLDIFDPGSSSTSAVVVVGKTIEH